MMHFGNGDKPNTTLIAVQRLLTTYKKELLLAQWDVQLTIMLDDQISRNSWLESKLLFSSTAVQFWSNVGNYSIVPYWSIRHSLPPHYPVFYDFSISLLSKLFITNTSVSSSGSITFTIDILTTPEFIYVSLETFFLLKPS